MRIQTGIDAEDYLTEEKLAEQIRRCAEITGVIPPDLCPRVPIDGGHFGTSDLNDLYRRVINRNNRLEALLPFKPEDGVVQSAWLLQKAVNPFFDMGYNERYVFVPGICLLKWQSAMLKGKQGRFRQNLLGKRVNDSDRSVIARGPWLTQIWVGALKLNANEIFEPDLYGANLVNNRRFASPHVAGIVAGWSIGEPGTQLLQRTCPNIFGPVVKEDIFLVREHWAKWREIMDLAESWTSL